MDIEKRPLNRDAIKYLAVLAMVLNHIADIFLEPLTPLHTVFTDIGYFTCIVMCWFLTEGYGYTHSIEKYGERLLLFGLLSELPYCLAFTKGGVLGFCGLDVICNLFLCFLMIAVLDRSRSRAEKTLVIAAVAGASFLCDWGPLAPLFTFLFHETKNRSGAARKAAWAVSAAAFAVLNFSSQAGQMPVTENLLYTLAETVPLGAAAVVIMYFYNGRKMTCFPKFNKWFFYVFYPAHLLLLGILRIAAGK